MKLSNGDLIKNFLFLGVHNFTENQEENLIYQFNEKVESIVDKKDIDTLHQEYLMIENSLKNPEQIYMNHLKVLR